MPVEREARALAILSAIVTGTIPAEHFTERARWWWNGGIDIPVPNFVALLGTLHEQTVGGIHVTPGLVMEKDEWLSIEATSYSPLTNGTIYDNRYIFLFQFEGDQVSLVKEYSDSAHVKEVFDLA